MLGQDCFTATVAETVASPRVDAPLNQPAVAPQQHLVDATVPLLTVPLVVAARLKL